MSECSKKEKFTCDWIFNILVVLSDGKVVCGCADPYGRRPLGHLRDAGLREIWNSEGVMRIRRNLNDGHSCFCHDCGLKRPLKEGEAPPQRPERLDVLPRIFFEPTVLCNLSCFKAECNKESGIVNTRERAMFPYDEFTAMLDSVGDQLIRLDFFNYGDPFVHPRAGDMLEYIKKKYPRIYLYSSTNGLMLDDAKIKQVIASGMDELTFSVDGSDAASYAKYRCGGDFDDVLDIMKKTVEARNRAGSELPFINWRYILFKWNDSGRHMKRAASLAAQIGVDRLTWEITNHPPEAVSEKYQVGTRHWKKIYHEIWDTSQIGSAVKGKRFTAKLKVLTPAIGMTVGAGPVEVRVGVKNTGGALWRKATATGRRLVRLGAQLYDGEGRLVDLNYARGFLNRDLAGKEKDILTLTLPPLEGAGDYRLKFDMVSEGNDWFESGGSPVTWKEFRVR